MEFLKYLGYVLLIIVALVLYAVYKAYEQVKAENQQLMDEDSNGNNEKIPYCRKFLLTKNEYAFYKSLKEVADKLNLTILAKVRLADLVDVNSEVEGKEKLKYFAKIKSKHIDFILCNKEKSLSRITY